MKITVLTPYLPHRAVGHGGGTAVRDLVGTLARRHEVQVVSLLRAGEREQVADVEALGVRVDAIPFLDAGVRSWRRLALAADRSGAWLRARASGYPAYVQKYHGRGLSRRVLTAVADFGPAAVQVEYLQMALLLRDLRRARDAAGQNGPRLVLNSHELGSLPRERRAALATDPRERRREAREAAAWRRLQVDASTWADTTLCVTPQDHELYAAMGGRNLRTVPLGMDTAAVVPVWEPTAGGPEEHLFVGSFGHRPNRLAAALLIESIWPAVRRRRPEARLLLAGRGSRAFLAERGPAPGVTALGFVDDLGPLFRRCRLFVAPLPEGGGIKIKVLEAMARGIPVVTTEVGAEGIAVPADRAVALAPADGSFADAVCRLADDDPEARAMSARARRLIEERFSWSAIADTLGGIYAGGA